uniref:ADAMTS/ADAMTS-like Spacer 1 domain-containing protein n=1 Tax=Nothoprocta perdicaria TaxID=30464 RepID=A0A8C6YX97_NOTPE
PPATSTLATSAAAPTALATTRCLRSRLPCHSGAAALLLPTVLRSPTGDPLLNGGGVAGPPGHYEAAGTIFEYRRAGPGAPETLSAPGPTTEPLDVYVCCPPPCPTSVPSVPQCSSSIPSAPGAPSSSLVMIPALPSPPPDAPPDPSAPSSGFPVLSVLPAPPHPRTSRWSRCLRRSRSSPFSQYQLCAVPSALSPGWRQPLFRCTSRRSREEVARERCAGTPRPPAPAEPCSTPPCPAHWRAGAWSPCSGSCGVGTQQRDVRCHLRGHPAPAARCASRLPPAATRSCPLPACGRWEVQSPWSTCSVPCGQGQRSRAVRCVSTQGPMHSEAACPPPRPPARQPCNMGPCARLWLHSDWSDTVRDRKGTGMGTGMGMGRDMGTGTGMGTGMGVGTGMGQG